MNGAGVIVCVHTHTHTKTDIIHLLIETKYILSIRKIKLKVQLILETYYTQLWIGNFHSIPKPVCLSHLNKLPVSYISFNYFCVICLV